MAITPNPFGLSGATLLVEHADDVRFARECMNMDAICHDELSADAIAGRQVLVVAETAQDGLSRLRDVIGRGISPLNARFVDIGYGTTLRTADLANLRRRFARLKDFLWDNTVSWMGGPPRTR